MKRPSLPNLRLPSRKSKLQQFVETVAPALDRPSGHGFGLPGVGAGSPLKGGLPQDKTLRAGLIAGGIAGLTAASAGVSSLRRRKEGARGDS